MLIDSCNYKSKFYFYFRNFLGSNWYLLVTIHLYKVTSTVVNGLREQLPWYIPVTKFVYWSESFGELDNLHRKVPTGRPHDCRFHRLERNTKSSGKTRNSRRSCCKSGSCRWTGKRIFRELELQTVMEWSSGLALCHKEHKTRRIEVKLSHSYLKRTIKRPISNEPLKII